MFAARCATNFAISGFFSVSVLFFTTAAHADPKACITTHATGQREAKAGHLRLATQLFTQCGSDESCPNQLRQECAELLQTVQQTVPSVIFAVLDEKGDDISAVKVFSTDELIADGLDGRAVQVDPGKHRFRFLLPWGAVLSSDVLIREGEKNRLIQVKLGDEAAPAESKPVTTEPPPAQVQAPPANSQPAVRSKPPVAAWILGGTAVAALGVGTTFAIVGSSKKSDINACSPNCGSDMHSTYDALKRDYLIADIGFAIGVVTAGLATWQFLTPRSSAADNRTSYSVHREPAVRPLAFALPGAAGVGVLGSF
jgi:hypothetical protein